MEKTEKKEPTLRPASYKMWVGVFWVFIVVAAGVFYYSTQKIAYVWHWNRVPIYFAYEDSIEITSDIDGQVASITTSGKESVITIKGVDGSKSYEAPADSVDVEQ